ncbi:MAG: helix-turn-helix domain-containing protein [Bacteroidaceae bacterium]|nr:helix-turn-helix domain-containing protein [Bacteroidaceae bacterium]
MKTLPLLVFIALISSAVLTSLGSCHVQARNIDNDVQSALSQTLAERPSYVVDADTIRVYRSYIVTAEVRDTASISVKTIRQGERDVAVFEADAGYSFLTLWGLSDQRPAGTLAVLAILWAIGCYWYRRRHPEVCMVVANGSHIAFGGLFYVPEESAFHTDSGTELHLTPMQQQLMEMFFRSPSHTLSKQDICNTLWPKKPDANDTLYTLIRRLKPVIEEHSQLKIESDRGRSYRLTDK